METPIDRAMRRIVEFRNQDQAEVNLEPNTSLRSLMKGRIQAYDTALDILIEEGGS